MTSSEASICISNGFLKTLATPRLELMLPLSSTFQRPIGNQLIILISNSSLEDMRDELFSYYNF